MTVSSEQRADDPAIVRVPPSQQVDACRGAPTIGGLALPYGRVSEAFAQSTFQRHDFTGEIA